MTTLLLIVVLIACFTPIIFSHEENVVELSAQNITSIDQMMLKVVPTETVYLNLGNNNISTVDPRSFQGFHGLAVLNLNKNRFLNFPTDGSPLFLQLDSLTDLQCFQCGVDKIYNRSLQGMPRLEQINLTENLIKQIDVEAFYGNQKLEQIDLRSNKLRWVPSRMLEILGNIRSVNLSSNVKLAPRDSEPFLISNVLEELWCDECGFVTIQELTFSKLPGLRQLYLRRNKISQIHSLAFHQVALKTVMLQSNALKTIDQSILNMESLHLCLDDNMVELECMLRDLFEQEKFFCLNTTKEDIECTPPTTITITTTTIITTTDLTTSPKEGKMAIMTANLPETSQTNEKPSTSAPSTPTTEKVEGISDAYISGYLTLIYLAQIVTLVLLVGVWLKLKKYDTDPDVDKYAENILNANRIYKAVY